MSRRAIVQIGTEKTGTTTLQRFLSVNRPALARRGFFYPRFCGEMNHTGLAAYALAPEKRDAIRGPFGGSEPAEVPAMRERLRRAAAAELPKDATAIFCSEHCHSRLTTPEEVATLFAFLEEFFDTIEISVYLRRQDQVALSLYSTRLKSGAVDRAILPRTNAEDPYFNYDRSLALWEERFGRENVHVRLFDRALFKGGSVVSDFLAAWKLGEPGDYVAVPDQNESIRPAAQEFLRLANTHLEPIDGLPIEEVRGPLASQLARLLPGRGARPSRAEAEDFYAKFRPSNEAVRRRRFPERETLFLEDFSGYPETADPREITPEEVAEIAARLHVTATREARRLEAEIALRDARLHWARDERDEAERALARALRWRPDHAESYRAMAEHMLRLDRLDEAIAAATRAAELRATNYEHWHFLGVLLRRALRWDRAAEAQARALALNPDHAASRHELAQVLVRKLEHVLVRKLEQVLVRKAAAEARAGGSPATNPPASPAAPCIGMTGAE